MSYDWLKAQERDRLEALVEDGEMTWEEAEAALEDWEAGYGDYMYDMLKDEQMEEAWANQ